jgi:hypothetical protein
LDDFDEVDAGIAENVMKAADGLTRESSTKAKVIIGSRPEGVLLSHHFKEELKYRNDFVSLLYIEPIEEQNLDFFLKRAFVFRKQDDAPLDNFNALLTKYPAVKKMTVEVDHVNKLVDLFTTLGEKGDFEVIESLVEERRKRSVDSHWARLGVNSETRMNEISEIALQMSSEGKSESNDARLKYSGFVTVNPESGQFLFSPKILQSYFAVRGLREGLSRNRKDDIPKVSRMLLEDVLQFKHRHPEVVDHLRRTFEQHPPDYSDSIDLLEKIIPDESVVYKTLRGRDVDELIKQFILKKR